MAEFSCLESGEKVVTLMMTEGLGRALESFPTINLALVAILLNFKLARSVEAEKLGYTVSECFRINGKVRTTSNGNCLRFRVARQESIHFACAGDEAWARLCLLVEPLLAVAGCFEAFLARPKAMPRI